MARACNTDNRNALNRLIAQAEQLAGPKKQAAQRAIAQQLSPELQALVDKAGRITKQLGATDRKRLEIKAMAEATAGLDREGSAYVLGRYWEKVKAAGKPLIEQLFWLRNNWLLSGPVTHGFYGLINAGSTGVEHTVIPAFAAAIDKVRGGNDRFWGEVVAGPYGIVLSVPGAFKAAGQAGKYGLRVPLESELKLAARGEESPQAKGASIPYLAHAGPDWGLIKTAADKLGVPMAARNVAELAAGGAFGRFANMQHTFFKVLNEGAQAHQNAYRATAKEGLNPLTDKNFSDRYNYHFLNPTDDALRDNVNAGYTGTFMEKLGEKTQRLASALKDTPLRWEFPFLHIPFNLERKGIAYGPLAIFGPEMRATLFGQRGAGAQADAIARVVIGSSAMGYVMHLVMQGRATGDYPTDPKERKRWEDLGVQPNSIQIGNEWVSYARWGPARIPMTIGANIGQLVSQYDGQDDGAMADLIGHGVVSTVHTVSEEVGFLALQQLFAAVENGDTKGQYAASQVSSFMPYSVGSGQVASFMDPYSRKTQSLIDGFKYRIPWTRQTLPAKRDAFGEPVPNPGYHTLNRESPVNADPLKTELSRLNYFPAPPQNMISGVKLTPKIYDEYQVRAGALAKTALERFVQQPGWHSMPAAAQIDVIRTVREQANQRAAQAMMARYPQIMQQAVENAHNRISGKPPKALQQ